MIPALGPQGAADLQRDMTQHLLQRLAPTSTSAAIPVFSHDLQVRFAAGDQTLMSQMFGPHDYVPQGQGDLGQRLDRAVEEGFSQRPRPPAIALIGADCPLLTLEHLQQAWSELRDHDVVIIPALDGGYTLIALKTPQPTLFQGPTWGTASVLQQTLALAKAVSLKVQLLESMSDVDEPEDLQVWERIHNGETQG